MKNPIERAFELADTGQYSLVESIRRQLRKEGLDANQIQGRTLSRQLKERMDKAAGRPAGGRWKSKTPAAPTE